MSSAPAAPGHPPPDLIGIDAPTLLQVESELSGKEVADPLRFVDLIERGFNLRAKLVRQSSTVGRHAHTHRHMAALPMSGRPTGNFHLPLYSMTDSVSSPSAILSPCTTSPPARVVLAPAPAGNSAPTCIRRTAATAATLRIDLLPHARRQTHTSAAVAAQLNHCPISRRATLHKHTLRPRRAAHPEHTHTHTHTPHVGVAAQLHHCPTPTVHTHARTHTHRRRPPAPPSSAAATRSSRPSTSWSRRAMCSAAWPSRGGAR
jgi:hypothetical protein